VVKILIFLEGIFFEFFFDFFSVEIGAEKNSILFFREGKTFFRWVCGNFAFVTIS